jgi:hypothetical protein
MKNSPHRIQGGYFQDCATVSGIKEWGAYQKAKAVFELRESGMTPQAAAQSLGLSTRNANQLWRSSSAKKREKITHPSRLRVKRQGDAEIR